MRWRRLCQAALQVCLSTSTLRGGAEQRIPLQPSCVQDSLQGAQLAVWHTAVHMACSCLQDAQLSAGCTAVCRLSQCSHGTVWHTALPGTHLSPGAQLCRAQLSQGNSYLRHRAVCGVHSWLRVHSSLQSTQLSHGTQLSAAAEFQ